MSGKQFAVLISVITLLVATNVYALSTNGFSFFTHKIPQVTVNMEYHFELADGAGVKDVYGSAGNLITDIGDQFASNITSGRTMTGYDYTKNGTYYIALGNGTNLAYSDTKLTTEVPSGNGFSRSSAITPTYASATGIGNGYYFNFTVTNKFTATAAYTINATSLHWSGVAGSDGNMFAEASIGTLPVGQAFAVNDNCTKI